MLALGVKVKSSRSLPLSRYVYVRTRDVHGMLVVPAILARSLTIQLCGAGRHHPQRLLVSRPSTKCARRVIERLRRLHDRVTGGLHPYLVMLVGVCLCVVWCVLSRRASGGGMGQKAKRRICRARRFGDGSSSTHAHQRM